MTGLLVSVRDAVEAAAALEGGATLIDVKEPRRGSLGRADTVTWTAVVEQVRGQTPLSVACGELVEWEADRSGPPVPPVVQFAKCGLSHCRDLPDWPARWGNWCATLHPNTHPVAVIYADGRRVAAPSAEHVLDVAWQVGCRAVLWDTCVKDGSHLLDHVADVELDGQVRLARRRGMLVVLAGSLAIEHVPVLARWAPDFVAVRGAVCGGNREGTVCLQRVADFVRALACDGHVPSRGPHAPTVKRDGRGSASVA